MQSGRWRRKTSSSMAGRAAGTLASSFQTFLTSSLVLLPRGCRLDGVRFPYRDGPRPLTYAPGPPLPSSPKSTFSFQKQPDAETDRIFVAHIYKNRWYISTRKNSVAVLWTQRDTAPSLLLQTGAADKLQLGTNKNKIFKTQKEKQTRCSHSPHRDDTTCPRPNP